jgi:hypothetical protein
MESFVRRGVNAATSEPTFCARCGTAGSSSSTLCAECGDALLPQGYCGICERFWRLSVGETCPKHDTPLDEAPQHGNLALLPDEHPKWVTVGAFAHPLEAEARRIRLEAEGIPTFLEGERMGQHGLYHMATGGVKLQVPQSLASDARIILSQQWSPPAELDDGLDDAWDELAPEPGTTRPRLMRAAIVVFLAIPLIRLLFVWLFG